jgi:hypothetical protein
MFLNEIKPLPAITTIFIVIVIAGIFQPICLLALVALLIITLVILMD